MRILTISDSPSLYSGLARVHRHVIDAFVEAGHQVLPCVWFGYDDDTMRRIKDKEIKPPPLFYRSSCGEVQMVTIPKDRNIANNVTLLHDIIKMSKADIVFTMGDPWEFLYFEPLKTKANFGFKWIAYLTIELEDMDESMGHVFSYADALITPTVLGKNALEANSGKSVSVIPFGVDTNKFRVFSDEERKNLREERGCADKIRFMTVAQNTWRKNLPALMQAVKIISHRDPEKKMQFYVHTNIDGIDAQEASMYDLRVIAEKLGVEDWFTFPEEDASIFSAPDDDFLAKEYNASDWFVTPTITEGFGLPFQESMACGLPVIASRASVMPEIIGEPLGESKFGLAERGWLVGNKVEVFPPAKLVKVIRHDALGEAIWQATILEDTRKIRENCVNYAKGRTWDAMKKALCGLVEGVGKAPAEIPVEIIP